MKAIIYYLFTILLISCQGRINEKKQITIGPVQIDVPNNAKYMTGKGIDSYVGYLINKQDTFIIEYGNNIYTLYDLSPKALPFKDTSIFIEKLRKLPSSNLIVFSESADEDNAENIFQTEYFLYDTVNSIKLKIVQPKKIGFGKTGIFVPKLKDGKSLSIYAKNLDSSAHRDAIEMYKTIRYSYK